MEAKAGLRIAYSNKKVTVDEWVDGGKSTFKDCLKKSKKDSV